MFLSLKGLKVFEEEMLQPKVLKVASMTVLQLCFLFAISVLAVYLANLPGRNQRYLRILQLFSSNSVFHNDVTVNRMWRCSS
jgi:hypothetical protein